MAAAKKKAVKKPTVAALEKQLQALEAKLKKARTKQAADEKNRVQVKVAPPQMGEITYDTCCGKFLPLVTPVRTANKDLLIIAVRVQPCHK